MIGLKWLIILVKNQKDANLTEKCLDKLILPFYRPLLSTFLIPEFPDLIPLVTSEFKVVKMNSPPIILCGELVTPEVEKHAVNEYKNVVLEKFKEFENEAISIGQSILTGKTSVLEAIGVVASLKERLSTTRSHLGMEVKSKTLDETFYRVDKAVEQLSMQFRELHPTKFADLPEDKQN